MNRLITEFLAIILAMMFIIAAIAEAQPMEKYQSLSAKQQGIITIAAFTAKGDLEKLKVSLNEGLDAGLTEAQLKSLISVLRVKVDKKEGENANEILSKVLSGRKSL